MIKIVPKSNTTIIGEDHLYTIMFRLQDALELYKNELNEYSKKDYSEMSAEEIHLMKWHKNKIFDTENILKEIEEAIDSVED